MAYNLSLSGAVAAKPVTLNLNVSGGTTGVDYSPLTEYSTDGGATWTAGNQVTLANANDINNLKVRVRVLDDYGQDAGNQNEGVMSSNLGAGIDPGITNFGIYKEAITLNVTTNNSEISAGSGVGNIIDNDDNVVIDGNIDGKTMDTKDGDDTISIKENSTLKDTNIYADNDASDAGVGKDVVNINKANMNNTVVNTRSGNDIIRINDVTGERARFFAGDYSVYRGSDNDLVEVTHSTLNNSVINTGYRGDDKIDVKSGTITNTYISTSDTGLSDVTVDANSTLKNVQIENQGGGTVDLSGDLKNVRVSVTNNDLDNGGTNHEYKSVVNVHSNMTGDSIDADYSSIMTGNGTDHINIDKGVTMDKVRLQMNAGDDALDLKDGVTFKGGNIHLGRENDPHMPMPNFTDNDTLNVKAGATLENSKISTQDGTDTINIEKGSTVRGNTFETGKGSDVINLNENISDSVMKLEEGNDAVNIANSTAENLSVDMGEGNDKVDVKDSSMTNSEIRLDDGENTLDIARTDSNSKVELKDTQIYGGKNKDVVNISNDTLEFAATPKVNLKGDTSINLGDGDNEVKVDGSVRLGEIENGTPTKNIITTGSGKDSITLQNGATVEERVIETGEGRDEVNIHNGASLNFAKIETGGGDDVVKFEHKTTNPLQGYSYSAATETEINMGDGNDTVNLQGMGNSGNYAGRVSDFQGANIDMGDNGIKHVQIDAGKVETTNIKSGSGDDRVEIQGDSLMEGRNSVSTGEGDDVVTIKDSAVKGQNSTSKTTIDTDEGNDKITAENSILDKVDINAGNGANEVTLGENSTFKDVRVTTGKDVDTINIESDMTGSANNRSDSIVSTNAGNDNINIKSGVTLTNTTVNTGAGEENVELDGVKFVNSELFTEGDNDTVTISNSKFENATTLGYSSGVGTGDGEDTVTVNSGAEFKQGTYLYTGADADTINVNSGATFNKADINAAEGDDKISINDGAQIQSGSRIIGGEGNDTIDINSGAKVSNSMVHAGTGDDTITVKSGANFNNYSEIRGDEGNDTIVVEKGADITNSVIKGGEGEDTLNISENIDFSKVKEIEKLKLGGAENDVETTLSAKDVLDMTDGNNKLKIDGESGDKLNLKDFTKGTVGADYTEYTGTTQSVTVEVKNDINVDIVP